MTRFFLRMKLFSGSLLLLTLLVFFVASFAMPVFAQQAPLNPPLVQQGMQPPNAQDELEGPVYLPPQGGWTQDPISGQQIYAEPRPLSPISACEASIPQWMVTTRIAVCVKMVVIDASVTMLSALSAILDPTIAVFMVFAICMVGLRVMLYEGKYNGPTGLMEMGLGFTVRLALVWMFSHNMGGLAAFPFALTDEAIQMVSGNVLPWVQIDFSIGKLFGFAPDQELFQGVLGLIGASLFSASAGLFMFVIGAITIFLLLQLMLRAIYSYLLSVVMMGFMVIISPLIIPLAIFNITERFFRKWLDKLISAMLLPILLFAFLSMFMGLIDSVVSGVFAILGEGGNDFRALWKNNTPLFSWALVTDPDLFRQYEQQSGAQPGTPIMPSNVNPMVGRAMQANFLYFQGLDFGPTNIIKFQATVMTFLGLGIVAYMMMEAISIVPQITANIAGSISEIQFEKVPIIEQFKKALSKVASKGTSKGTG